MDAPVGALGAGEPITLVVELGASGEPECDPAHAPEIISATALIVVEHALIEHFMEISPRNVERATAVPEIV